MPLCSDQLPRRKIWTALQENFRSQIEDFRLTPLTLPLSPFGRGSLQGNPSGLLQACLPQASKAEALPYGYCFSMSFFKTRTTRAINLPWPVFLGPIGTFIWPHDHQYSQNHSNSEVDQTCLDKSLCVLIHSNPSLIILAII